MAAPVGSHVDLRAGAQRNANIQLRHICFCFAARLIAPLVEAQRDADIQLRHICFCDGDMQLRHIRFRFAAHDR